ADAQRRDVEQPDRSLVRDRGQERGAGREAGRRRRRRLPDVLRRRSRGPAPGDGRRGPLGAALRGRPRRIVHRGQGLAGMALQCVILAGGLGTRMRPLTETVPKALVPVLGRPFADWQLTLLREQGAERVVYCTGYRGGMLRAHVGDGSRFGLTVAWSDEGAE